MARIQAGGRVGGATLPVLALAFFAAAASAADAKFPAAVAWAHDDLVYLTAPDSGTLAEGMRLGIERRHHRLANVTITRTFEPRLAVAHVDSGAVTFKKRFDRLQVVPLAPAVPHVAVLRVGLPGRGRGGLLFSCTSAGVASQLGSTRYDVQPSGRDTFRLLRSDSTSGPDTLLVRTFTDAADQEIALERGEVDVAVFWPGEPSARMRADPRWRGFARGIRAGDVLVASPGTAVALRRMNHDLFGDDLLESAALASDTSTVERPARWIVSVPNPDRRTLERTLLGRGTRSAWPTTTGLWYRSAADRRRDPTPRPLQGVSAVIDGPDPDRAVEVFTVRCPVVAARAAQPVVAALGADAFASLMLCGSKSTP